MTVRSGCSTVLQIELAGTEFDVLVDFDVENYSSEDPETGGGDSAEVTITGVRFTDDNGVTWGDRDITEVLKGIRDLKIETFTRYPRITYLGCAITLYKTPITETRYGNGFCVHGGVRMYNGFHPAWITFNEGRTMYDRLYNDLIEYVHENERDWIWSDEAAWDMCD